MQNNRNNKRNLSIPFLLLVCIVHSIGTLRWYKFEQHIPAAFSKQYSNFASGFFSLEKGIFLYVSLNWHRHNVWMKNMWPHWHDLGIGESVLRAHWNSVSAKSFRSPLTTNANLPLIISTRIVVAAIVLIVIVIRQFPMEHETHAKYSFSQPISIGKIALGQNKWMASYLKVFLCRLSLSRVAVATDFKCTFQ